MSKQLNSKKEYYLKTISDLQLEFETNIEYGIKASELNARYDKYGFNELPKIKKSLWKIYLAPIFNILIIILLVSAIFVVILGDISSTIITFSVVILNSVTLIIQQYRARKALESLRKIAALKANVMRDGRELEIPTRELLPGDIILISEGAKVPADARIIEAVNLSLDEAPLTGESEPVEKDDMVLNKSNLPLQEQLNMIFMGTFVDTGRAKALVVGTGLNTEIGKISTQLNEMGSIEDIPLTHKLNRLGYILGTMVVLILISSVIDKLILLDLEGTLYGEYINNALVDSILTAMNIMPVNLPILATLVLVTGILNMARSGVIVKNMAAIESLGRVSVIVSDKTGTITRNEMTVGFFWINNHEFSVSGTGYEADGEIFDDGMIADFTHDLTFKRFIDSIIINNNAKLIRDNVKIRAKDKKQISVRRAVGSPTEAALLVLVEKVNIIPQDVKQDYTNLKEFSFNSELKQMTTVCKLNSDGEIYAYSKGAPEKILDLCSNIEANGNSIPFSASSKNELINNIQNRARQGYRILAVAYRKLNHFENEKRKTIENNLTFLSFVSILDPPRKGVRESVEEAQNGGVKVVMITGDHPATAMTIASQMEIYKPGDLIVESSEIDNLSTEEFNKVSVFARVNPSDKQVIVKRYQEQNKICAMTGDGINDALALKLANAGIAMGITGTDVAKETSDMVISDDNFTSIVNGIKIGRGLFSKIRTIIYFFISLNIMEAFIFFTYEFIPSIQLFSSQWQHVYIFAIAHSFPSLALVGDRIPLGVMKEPPRNKEELLNKNMWVMLIVQVAIMGLGLVLAFQLTLEGVIPLNKWNLNPLISYLPPGSTHEQLIEQKARTMFITSLYIAETTFIWTFRRPNKSIFQSLRNELSKLILVVTIATLGLHVLFISFSYPVNHYVNDVLGWNFQFNFMYLSITDWLICIALAIPGHMGIEIFKLYARKRKIFF